MYYSYFPIFFSKNTAVSLWFVKTNPLASGLMQLLTSLTKELFCGPNMVNFHANTRMQPAFAGSYQTVDILFVVLATSQCCRFLGG